MKEQTIVTELRAILGVNTGNTIEEVLRAYNEMNGYNHQNNPTTNQTLLTELKITHETTDNLLNQLRLI